MTDKPSNIIDMKGAMIRPLVMELRDLKELRDMLQQAEEGNIESYAVCYYTKDSRVAEFCVTPMGSMTTLLGGVQVMQYEIAKAISDGDHKGE